jgi:hypothetical protein
MNARTLWRGRSPPKWRRDDTQSKSQRCRSTSLLELWPAQTERKMMVLHLDWFASYQGVVQQESNHCEKWATGKASETNHRHHKHSPWNRRNGGYTCRLFRVKSLKEGVMWCIDPLLGNGMYTSNRGTCQVHNDIMQQQKRGCKRRSLWVRSKAIWLNRLSSVEWMSAVQWSELFKQSVRELLQFSRKP